MKTKCQYNHTICNNIDDQGGAQGGAGMMILIEDKYIVLGFDNYHKKYTLCTGRRNNKETCYIETIEREAVEEFKLDIASLQRTKNNVFHCHNKHFINKLQDIRYVVIGKTPIFIGKYKTNDINVQKLNKKIEQDNQNENLTNDLKEMNHLKVFLRYSIKKEKEGYFIKTSSDVEYEITWFTYEVINSLNTKQIEN